MATASQPRPQVELTQTEIDHLHDDDLHAARIVVGLMTAVFTIGLVMYAVICWIAM